MDELDQAGPRRRRKKVAAAADASFSSGLFSEIVFCTTLNTCNFKSFVAQLNAGGEDEDPDFQLPSTSKVRFPFHPQSKVTFIHLFCELLQR